ncbi:MAG: YqcI/YcgG family protein [Bdellovibrionaceae bacterium]|nr:YqcI/YcgG family protein [Pseudobdellovibrionaceae bacterium]
MKHLFEEHIRQLVQQKNYPCVAAIAAMAKNDYQLETYSGFGSGSSCERLAKDLIRFRDEYVRTKSAYLSFFAIFDDAAEMTEEEFESRLWKELSYMSSVEGLSHRWDPEFSDNPEDKNFCFSLDRTAFFVVGMHPKSSRKARQFSVPALVFNVYDQFRELQKHGRYDPMVHLNRKRDIAYQGAANPMAELYGDQWEAIQFSGKNNSEEWKCPFHRGLKPETVKTSAETQSEL